MSKSRASKDLKLGTLKFVIPLASPLIYSRITKTDKALCFLLDKGYIESPSLELCYNFSLFVTKTGEKDDFILFDNIEKVILKSGITVYRQRLYFTDLVLLLRILKNFDIPLSIPSSLYIGIEELRNCYTNLSTIESCMSTRRTDNYRLGDWLTDCLLAFLWVYCKHLGVTLDIYKRIEELAIEGLLDNAPYLCGAVDRSSNKSSIIIIPNEYLFINGVDILINENSENNLNNIGGLTLRGLVEPRNRNRGIFL